ncbi:hypothetical protein LWI28_005447 [Acer negundo]|uniref:Uncharacterized protein n=1 Tax=Acer negundo TaxID=4023 RepID=A0AAD5P134_ACENE|nr:hypothetical protein LWI28_005447 [Acer negundo]KAK4856240.1 hypothetical protein QYF36_015551 [Acer negundo]
MWCGLNWADFFNLTGFREKRFEELEMAYRFEWGNMVLEEAKSAHNPIKPLMESFYIRRRISRFETEMNSATYKAGKKVVLYYKLMVEES